jgi:hypothetical protein
LSQDQLPPFDISAELTKLIAYHRGWKKFSSYASFVGSALSIIAAAAASVVAGLGYAATAAVIAAFATVFTSLEKVLQFRERWDLHRSVEDDLDQLRWERAERNMTAAQVTEKVNEIRNNYTTRMSSFRVLGG